MLFLLFVFFLIASAFLVNGYITTFLAPDLFVFLRMGISGILLFIIYCRNKEILTAAKNHFFFLFLIASLTTFLPSLLRAYALQNILASRASFWGALEPFIASLYLYILYNEQITKYQVIGCVLSCFASIFFIVMQAKENIFIGAIICLADLAQLGSIFISRFGWIKAQELMKQNIFAPQQLNAFCFIISSVLSLLLFISRKGKLDYLYPLLHNYSFLGAFLYTIIIGNMIAYTLYAYALKNTVVTYVAIAGLSMPLFVHLLSVLFLHEALSPSFFLSIILIAIALFIFQKKDSQN
jgi:drug/metabolite transporter (DMT)-like permease